MSFSPMLGPMGWILLGLVPPMILLLYFLKLRRMPLEVPSTYLWTKTIEDLHVNSIWQRLRNSLLLLLQILLALLLLLACLGPGCQGQKLAGDRFIHLIDQSASMSATDLPGGQTRLEFAKQEAAKLIDSMDSGDAAMIISFSDRANVQQSYTRNRSLLKRKLAEIQQTQRSSDIGEALLAASGLANPGRTSDRESERDVQVADALAASLIIFSDGAVKDVANFSLGNLAPEYRPVGALDVPNNVGITAFAISDDLDSVGLQAFAQIQNSDDEDHSVDVELYVNGEIHDLQNAFEVQAGDTRGISFDLSGLLDGLESPLPVRLEIKDPDVYLLDNVAYGTIQPPRQARVLVLTRNNPYLQYVFETDRLAKLSQVEFKEPGFLQTKEYRDNAMLGVYDCVIFDQCIPEAMPQCNTVFIGSVPPNDQWQASEREFPTLVVDTDDSHPLMYNVQMGNVLIIESTRLSGPQAMVTLMESTAGPIMGVGPRGGFEDLVIGFPIVEYSDQGEEAHNSDWPNHLSFPLFVQNVVIALGGGARFDANQGTRPGELVNIRTVVPSSTITVRDPEGETVSLGSRGDRRFVYGSADSTGIYSVIDQASNREQQLFPVNLLDPRESNLVVREKLEVGYEEIAGTVESIPETRQFWPWLVLFALIVLILEWFIYNRRVFI
ncbi:MAG: BatA and WFA domain-containing protein [Mariniblastus sp.]|nr:BatA and WFA domain-containing protein [Mariniblastus sp.]